MARMSSEDHSVRIADDGTYWILQLLDNKLLKVRQSDGQLLIRGGLTTDETL